MKEYYLTKEKIDAFASMLYQAEKSKATIEKYLRSIRMFSQYLAGNPVNKSAAITWKEQLQQQNNYAPSTVNAALAALNNLFSFLGWTDCRTHYLKIQRRLFRDAGQELCREDYERLVSVAYNTGHKKIALIMETICATGIRVSELRYVTVEAARAGQATVFLKGKIRTIILPSKLCRKLLDYPRGNCTVASVADESPIDGDCSFDMGSNRFSGKCNPPGTADDPAGALCTKRPFT